MSGRDAVRQARVILLGTTLLAVVLALLDATVPVDWDIVAERLESLPWGGLLWWLFRTALSLASGIF